jgi:hypothetical protein
VESFLKTPLNWFQFEIELILFFEEEITFNKNIFTIRILCKSSPFLSISFVSSPPMCPRTFKEIVRHEEAY